MHDTCVRGPHEARDCFCLLLDPSFFCLIRPYSTTRTSHSKASDENFKSSVSVALSRKRSSLGKIKLDFLTPGKKRQNKLEETLQYETGARFYHKEKYKSTYGYEQVRSVRIFFAPAQTCFRWRRRFSSRFFLSSTEQNHGHTAARGLLYLDAFVIQARSRPHWLALFRGDVSERTKATSGCCQNLAPVTADASRQLLCGTE